MTRKNLFLVETILQLSNAGKQILGRRFAYTLGFTPGPRGSDDGIDGLIEEGETKIHFQSKLRSRRLDREDARSYYSDIDYHEATASIILSGVGYKDTFVERLYGQQGIKNIEVHLLQLSDIFEKNEKFQKACKILPDLRYLDESIKKELE